MGHLLTPSKGHSKGQRFVSWAIELTEIKGFMAKKDKTFSALFVVLGYRPQKDTLSFATAINSGLQLIATWLQSIPPHNLL
ncbi:hypothetical protein [Geobacter sp.]|uniref:hypothetical protein n=1 Tax=Geobacter sp. TaxID=46610 RepID=UPI0026155E1A|nr:hypothetical protein [Geobacter sp.]